MANKDFMIKQKTSTGFDVLHPETRAEQVIINSATGATLATHLEESMPHTFVDNGKTYRWGFRTVNGEPQMIYEEVTT